MFYRNDEHVEGLQQALNNRYPTTDSLFFCYSLLVYYLLGAVIAIIGHFTSLPNFYVYVYLFCGFIYFITNIIDLRRCKRYSLREYVPEKLHENLTWLSNIIYSITAAAVLVLLPRTILTNTVVVLMFVLIMCNLYRIFMTMSLFTVIGVKEDIHCSIYIPSGFLKPYTLIEGIYKDGIFKPYGDLY